MLDPTPPPFGDVTRRWTHLDDAARSDHLARLLPAGCGSGGQAHVERPAVDAGVCYRELIPPAVAGDPVALGWLATSHRPLLLVRGRALFDHDPSEWGAVCLEALHTTLAAVDLRESRWLRRRVAQQLTTRVAKAAARQVARRRREQPTAPLVLPTLTARPPVAVTDGQLELSLTLERLLGRLDPPTRDGIRALADRVSLAEVAARHGMTHAAVRQRVTRARRRLQPALAGYRRTDDR